ncbi:MAG: glycosyltransferase [Deltaproteobacteria bacterium]|nr:glycosyltransferase [Deltaproteobacteria bacterium]
MNPALRVIILTPTAFPNVTGNAITAERWRRSLSQKGLAVNVMETQHLDARGLVYGLDRFRPHIVHAHHVSRAGVLMLDPLVAEKYGALPFVVSPAGTDVNPYALKGAERDAVVKTCRMARCIISQSREITRLLQELLPDMEERIAYVPKAFLWFGSDHFDLRTIAACREENILFFMPAGIRPVKGNLECLWAMEKVHESRPKIRVVFAGPALDAGYAARFLEEIRRLGSFAKWILQIPPEAMCSAYQGADVILNHSSSEGLSNPLLEAMAAGRPVLASDIPGNRWLIGGEEGIGPCGSLFNLCDRADFVLKALQLANDAVFRESLAATSRLRAAAWPNPSDEAQALLKIYEGAISRKG